MPFEARKNFKEWGPSRASVELRSGDEVPAPVKLNLFKNGFVVKVDAVSGKQWCDQPEAAQQAWAEEGGTTRLIPVAKPGEEQHPGVTVKIHPTQLVGESDEPPYTKRKRPLPTEAPGPARSEPLEVAGGEVSADESAPPQGQPKGPAQSHKSKKRGRRSRR